MHGGVQQRRARSLFALLVMLGLVCPVGLKAQSQAKKAQEEVRRKIKSTVQPTYPELARKLNMSGVVKLTLLVAPDGKVKDVKIVGGPPLFTDAAVNAVRHWRYVPAHEITTEVIEIRFSRP